MEKIGLFFQLLEDDKTHNLYMAIEDVLEVMRYYQQNIEEFVQSDFTFVEKVDMKELN